MKLKSIIFILLILTLTEVFSGEIFPRRLTDSTSEITNDQMRNANAIYELYSKCKEEQDSSKFFSSLSDSIILSLKQEIEKSKQIEKSQKSEIKNLKELIQIKDDKFTTYVINSKKDSRKQNIKTFLINTFIVAPTSFTIGAVTGFLIKK